MTEIERFWAKVDKRGPDDCWEWTGRRYEHGYGNFWAGGRGQRSSRGARHNARAIARHYAARLRESKDGAS